METNAFVLNVDIVLIVLGDVLHLFKQIPVFRFFITATVFYLAHGKLCALSFWVNQNATLFAKDLDR